ncbi:hypothetical protein DDE82_006219 [Stemphylium lycopersici]|uniref:Arginase/deacetylase n=1 Tax=Stemphylium lycopersici TaxID=183478 RepID=A0A364N1Q8_STELY|nr:hypothetical protein TW65_00676 [Stemphylium lycopersici]RAR01880.1 hypothetical protein DDE82_006219 [Stemphylium lycopersici]RAR09434.1 hypothetical protein DDE83_005505 [Stemphylium lycopersici]
MSSTNETPGSVHITHVPADCGSIIPGKSKATQAFETVDVFAKFCRAHVSIADCSTVTPSLYHPSPFVHGNIRNRSGNLTLLRNLRDSMRKSIAKYPNAFQLILGGECCMLPTILKTFQEQHKNKELGLIYIDADTDMSHPDDPDWNGYFASMTMTQLMERPEALTDDPDATDPLFGEEIAEGKHTVLFGTNLAHPGNKPEHFIYLSQNGFRVLTSREVASDPTHSAHQALQHLSPTITDVNAIWVHLDIDSIDPGEFPLANVPNFTGIRFEQMMEALEILLADERVLGLTVAEVNPDHDPGLHMTTKLVDAIVAMLGARFAVEASSSDGSDKMEQSDKADELDIGYDANVDKRCNTATMSDTSTDRTLGA